jgi:DNA-binding CsgD family transcriptional regulator
MIEARCWTKREVGKLFEWRGAGMSVAEIAQRLGRTKSSVRSRLNYEARNPAGLRFERWRKWETELLYQLRTQSPPVPYQKIAQILSFDTQRVRQKAFHMGLARKLGTGGAKEREAQVLTLLHKGNDTRAIARQLSISEGYVVQLIKNGA